MLVIINIFFDLLKLKCTNIHPFYLRYLRNQEEDEDAHEKPGRLVGNASILVLYSPGGLVGAVPTALAPLEPRGAALQAGRGGCSLQPESTYMLSPSKFLYCILKSGHIDHISHSEYLVTNKVWAAYWQYSSCEVCIAPGEDCVLYKCPM